MTWLDDYFSTRDAPQQKKAHPRRVEDLPRKSDRSRQVRDAIYAMSNDGAPGPVLGRDYAIGAAAMAPAGLDTLGRMAMGGAKAVAREVAPYLTDNAQSRSLFEAASNRAPASGVSTLPELQATARRPSLATRARAMGADALAGGQEALQGLGSAAMNVGMGAARSTVDPTYLPRLAAPAASAVGQAVVSPFVDAPRQMGEGGRTLRTQGYELARPTLARAAGNTALAALTVADAPMLARGVAGLARGARSAPVAARAAEGAAVREAAPVANYADDAPTDGQPLFRVDPTPRPASGGNFGTAGLGLAAAGGALAAPDDARAQEVGGRQRAEEVFAQKEADVASLRQKLRSLQAFNSEDPQEIRRLQRYLNTNVDGIYRGKTIAARNDREADLKEQLAQAEAELNKAKGEARQRQIAGIERELAPDSRQAGLTLAAELAAFGAGTVLSKTGLPFTRGMGGRAGNVRAVEKRILNDMVNAERIPIPTTPLGKRNSANDAEAARRAANLNQYWSYGGAKRDWTGEGGVPFKFANGRRPTIRRTADRAEDLFQAPRFNSGDYGAIGIAGTEVAGVEVLKQGEQKKAETARAEVERLKAEGGDPALIRSAMERQRQAENAVAAMTVAQRFGLGYGLGRIGSGYIQTPKLPRPNYAAAQAEQGRLAEYLYNEPTNPLVRALRGLPRTPEVRSVPNGPRVKSTVPRLPRLPAAAPPVQSAAPPPLPVASTGATAASSQTQAPTYARGFAPATVQKKLGTVAELRAFIEKAKRDGYALPSDDAAGVGALASREHDFQSYLDRHIRLRRSSKKQ